MHSQALIVALLVLGCSVYAVWTLMPSVARRALAASMLKLPLPEVMATRMRKAAKASSGCGCDGCDRSELKVKAPVENIVTFHRRAGR
ncbi:hypothetical protein BH11PSE9_BH11PSE9_15160 [soil metagenome]